MEWNQIVNRKQVFEEILTPLILKASKLHWNIYPQGSEVFKALDLTAFNDVKVCILGQDPYHTADTANGLAFSVTKGHNIPPSLQNIFKELETDMGIKPAPHGDLSSWAKQGVLLLNTALTVVEGEPGSHMAEWERVTGEIINRLTRREDPVIFVLWGKKAQEVFQKNEYHHEHRVNPVLITSHPSPFSATKGFFGCKHFSKINERLISMGKSPIDWRVDVDA